MFTFAACLPACLPAFWQVVPELFEIFWSACRNDDNGSKIYQFATGIWRLTVSSFFFPPHPPPPLFSFTPLIVGGILLLLLLTSALDDSVSEGSINNIILLHFSFAQAAAKKIWLLLLSIHTCSQHTYVDSGYREEDKNTGDGKNQKAR